MQGAFAAACAERIVPLFFTLVRPPPGADAETTRRGLDAAWAAVEQANPTLPSLPVHLTNCLELASRVDDSFGLDAVSAVVYAIQAAASIDTDAAGWAAMAVTDPSTAMYSTQLSIKTGPMPRPSYGGIP